MKAGIRLGCSLGLGILSLGEPVLAQAAADLIPSFSIRLEKKAQPLALKDAVKLGLNQNQEILKARNTVLRAEAGVTAARAAWIPSLTANTTYSGQQGGGVTLDNSLLNNVNINGTVDWTVYDQGRQARIDLTLLQRDRARLDLKTQERSVALRITEAYYDLQQADSDLTIQQAAIRVAEANLQQVQKRQRAGAATRYDTLQQEVQLANNRQQLFTAQNAQARNRLVLADLLNLNQSIPVQASDPIVPATDWSQALDQTLTTAISLRPELMASQRDREIALTQQAITNTQLQPRLTLSTAYGINNNLSGISQDQLTVSVSARWLLYDGGATTARAEQFVYDQRNSELDVSLTAQKIRGDIERAYLAKETAKAQLESAGVASNQARESLDLVRRRQQLGISLQIEVIAAERALTEARQNYSNAIISYNRALSQLSLAIGLP